MHALKSGVEIMIYGVASVASNEDKIRKFIFSFQFAIKRRKAKAKIMTVICLLQ